MALVRKSRKGDDRTLAQRLQEGSAFDEIKEDDSEESEEEIEELPPPVSKYIHIYKYFW